MSLRRVLAAGLFACVLLFTWGQSVRSQEQYDTSDEIVYIDGVGFIRVLDYVHTAGGQTVNWRSAEGDWRDFVLGDFDGSGADDMEIAAVRTDGGVGRLVIFDPVIADDAVVPGQRIDDIPWKILCDLSVEGSPTRLAAGEFDTAIAGDELVVGATTSSDDDDGFGPYLVSVLHRTGGTPTCPWSPIIDRREFNDSWTLIDAANLDHVGVDDVILLDDDESVLEVYRIDNGMDETTDRIMNFESKSRNWRDAAPGNYQTTLDQLAVVRTSPIGLPSLLVMQYRNVDSTWVDTYTQDFAPNPRVVFRGDLDGNGDDEIIMMREISQADDNNNTRPRIFMRNPSDTALPPFEQPLDRDNGFRAGAAGDVDGDGKDEIAIIRDLQLRLYLDPDATSESIRYRFTGYATSTNERSIQTGDLDGQGYVGRPYLLATPNPLETQAIEGQIVGPFPIDVTQPSGPQELEFTLSVTGNPVWVNVTPSSGGTTPATLYVAFNTRFLFPGTYSSSVVLATVNSDVLTNTTTVDLKLTVTSGIFASPSAVTTFSACDVASPPITIDVAVSGTAGQSFTAGIAPENGNVPAWITVTPETGTSPETLTLAIDPEQRATNTSTATLLIETGSGDTMLRIPVMFSCVDARVWLPLIGSE